MRGDSHALRGKLPEFLRRHVLLRQLPHGLISILYLHPHPCRAVAEHRRLWLNALPGLPRPLFFALEFWLWLRWLLYGAWRQTWLSLRRHGPDVRKEEGIGLLRQALGTLGPALAHTLTPGDLYRFRLYRKDRLRRWLEYVYDHELPSFHFRRSLRLGGPDPESLRILQDKFRFGELLGRYGLNTVPLLEVVPPGTPFDFDRHLRNHERLFCKTRNGSRGRGAFTVEKGKESGAPLITTNLNGISRESLPAVLLPGRLEPDDYLIQPWVIHHPALAGLAGRNDAVTVRYITLQPLMEAVRCYCAILEIPAAGPETGAPARGGYIILPIDPATGMVQPFPESWLPSEAKAQYHSLAGKLAAAPLPCWGELGDMAGKAHALFPTIYAIAWDFIIASDGPVLLEGNVGWGAAVPQKLTGGLLAKNVLEVRQ